MTDTQQRNPMSRDGALESRSAKSANDSGETLQLVTFGIGNEEFAIEILAVQEIVGMMQITDVPQSPPSVVGVVNLRGQITPVVDLRERFGLEPREHSQESRIIVVEVQGRVLGFIVDRVNEVMQIDTSLVDPAPSISTSVDATYVKGVGKLDDRLLILLEHERLFKTEEMETADAAGAETPAPAGAPAASPAAA